MSESVRQNENVLDPQAWVERYGDYLYGYALSRLRDVSSAEEVVQESFVAGLRHAQQYAGRGSERAWLLGILKRKIIDLVRKRSRSRNANDDDDLSELLFDEKGNWRSDPRGFGPQPGAALEKQDFWRTFRHCLSTLPEKQADVFSLRELDGKSGDEICKDLQVTPSNLWVLLYRARIRLAQCMKTQWEGEA